MFLPLAEVLASDSSPCHQTAIGWEKKNVEGGSNASDRMGKWDSFEQPFAYNSLAPRGQRGLIHGA